jgi:hypothetical protein
VKVSSAANVSNPTGDKDGGKGVCSLSATFPRYTHMSLRRCAYRNKLCPANVGCHYDLRMHKDVYLCGREQLYDQGYLREGDYIHSCVTLNVPCPPNYGRYFNTAVVSADPSVAVPLYLTVSLSCLVMVLTPSIFMLLVT